MKVFEIKQKFWSLGGRFIIKDQDDQPCYEVEGSFLKWFKEFTIRNQAGQEVAFIKRQFSWFLSQFTVDLADGSHFVIHKEFTLFKPRYYIEGLDMVVQGDFWDMNFTLTKDGQTIADIKQYWFMLTSTYQVTVHDDNYCDLVLALVIAIDYVKEQTNSGAGGAKN
jgi:uncharacterized protein YxjI